MLLHVASLLLLSLGQISFCKDSSVLIIIRSQNNEYHAENARQNKASLDAQIKKSDLNAKVILLHETWAEEYAWTILPLISDISNNYASFDWVMFIEEGTKIDMEKLVKKVLVKYDYSRELYVGRCLFDNDASIIHHYAFFNGKVKEFKFPDFHAGWLMSKALVRKVARDLETNKIKSDFQIDVQHEIAMHLDKTHNVKMTCDEKICGGHPKDDCATWIDYEIPDCGNKITLNDLLISVKTTKKFHGDRVQVVKETWGKYPKNIIYYSNVTDPSIPTIDCGVPNTVRGHCGKMEVIIRNTYEKEELKKFPWLVIADDDSIIGLAALVKLLNCYDPKVSVVLGERYGFGLTSGYGYGYITGGGGMIMSRAAVEAWVTKGCKCHSNESPDDMILGQCFSYQVKVPVTHSPRFHQARPDDYSDGYLENLQPVSFHKHWEIDPIKVYKKYFAEADEATFNLPFEPEPTEAPAAAPVPIPPTPTEFPKDEL